jgi:predicted kinase
VVNEPSTIYLVASPADVLTYRRAHPTVEVRPVRTPDDLVDAEAILAPTNWDDHYPAPLVEPIWSAIRGRARLGARVHAACPVDAVVPAPLLRVMIGAPGSGKTTLCQLMRPHWRCVELSLDNARSILGTGPGDMSATAAAVEMVRSSATRHLRQGTGVVIDATGSQIRDRATWLEVAWRTGARPVAVVLRPELGNARTRNGLRPPATRVPDLVVDAMWRRIRDTTARDLLAEGFLAVTEL